MQRFTKAYPQNPRTMMNISRWKRNHLVWPRCLLSSLDCCNISLLLSLLLSGVKVRTYKIWQERRKKKNHATIFLRQYVVIGYEQTLITVLKWRNKGVKYIMYKRCQILKQSSLFIIVWSCTYSMRFSSTLNVFSFRLRPSISYSWNCALGIKYQNK